MHCASAIRWRSLWVNRATAGGAAQPLRRPEEQSWWRKPGSGADLPPMRDIQIYLSGPQDLISLVDMERLSFQSIHSMRVSWSFAG